MKAATPHGMLFVASDIGADDEADFNAWYDREHIEQRVRMDGVISAARYYAVEGKPRYLSLYWAESLAVFASPAYADAFRNQTPWSVRTLPKMLSPTRRIGEVSASVGQGSGAWVGVLPLDMADDLKALADQCSELGAHLSADPRFVHSYLLTPNDELSRPLPLEDLSTRRMQPLLIIESSEAASNASAVATASLEFGCARSQAARYALMWKLSAKELA
ncbi:MULTISPECIES: DUF4286 family protein [Paraburkholderia]|uniref:DUF4286 family protein n=1 Tax=Paraburkholderia TaxID=1822464 RepID=UPI0006B5C233|nr:MULTISPECIES: DUF4286 family protein [Paraburkholderia]KPD15760.1 hypothetical protein ADM96_30600 [Burkholderia sp. ST111]MBK5153484.1 hypothetical protein [Burkholderia sp. R-69608]MBK5185571.1 hypothetical protein [Burkholderia sp. R-69749]CAE6881278.1 hypothetical protein R69749_07051 [Paraburkholderia domus]CAE6972303.1 hypothetical protein R69608_07793 [Paraburkholderia nemoris]